MGDNTSGGKGPGMLCPISFQSTSSGFLLDSPVLN
jgi:hypothetical protein